MHKPKSSALKYLAVFVVLILGYLAFGTVANLLPNKPIHQHVKDTVERKDLAADFWFSFLMQPAYYMDNYTDALILNQACQGGKDHMLESLLLVPRLEDSTHMQCSSLSAFVAGDPHLQQVHYGRYWHGSTFLMRFLLCLDNYIHIRYIFYIISSLMMLWVAALLARHRGIWAAVLYCCPWVLINVVIMQHSIQFVPVLIIALAASLWIIYRVRHWKQLCITLFVVGSLTCYFDLLTCPILTWGIPICTYLLMHHQPSFLRGLQTWFHAYFLWVIGYGGTWISKWLIASLLTDENVIADGLAQVSSRAATGHDFSRWDALAQNLDMLHWPYIFIPLILLCIAVAFKFRRKGLCNAALCLITALVPCLWFIATAEHAYLHYWFTYRNLAVSLMALFFGLAMMVDWRLLHNNKKQKNTVR